MQTPECQFDVFFIYKTEIQTSKWVRDTCRDLERMHIVCGYHERDFKIGKEIPENIIHSIKTSKKIAIVLTPEFNSSEWCKFDLTQTLRQKVPCGGDTIIPLFLNICEDDIPTHLAGYTGLDVSGKREEWWDRLVKTLDDSNEDETQMIYYHFQKLEKAIASATLASTAKVIDLLQDSASTHVQRQCGTEYTRGMLLNAIGIEVNLRKLRFDVGALSKEFTEESKLIMLTDIFNKHCASKNIHAELCRKMLTGDSNSFPPEDAISVKVPNGRGNAEVSFWIWGQLDIYLGFACRFSRSFNVCNIEALGYCPKKYIQLAQVFPSEDIFPPFEYTELYVQPIGEAGEINIRLNFQFMEASDRHSFS